VGGAVSAAVIRLVVGTHRIVRADDHALEGIAQDAGKSWRRPDEAAETNVIHGKTARIPR
jgi:hypothetical protein